MNFLHFHINADVEKTHGFNLSIGNKFGVGIDIQWRSWQANDAGIDPLMLSISFNRWFQNSENLHCFLGKTLRIINPSTEISALQRLSLSLHGKSYWCDERGEKDSIWNFRYLQRKLKKVV